MDDEPPIGPGIPDLIVTPHGARAAFEAPQRGLDERAADVLDVLEGGRRGRMG